MKALKLIDVIVQPGTVNPNGLIDGFYYFNQQVYQSLGGIAWVVSVHPDNFIPEKFEHKMQPSLVDTVPADFALKAIALASGRSVDHLKALNE